MTCCLLNYATQELHHALDTGLSVCPTSLTRCPAVLLVCLLPCVLGALLNPNCHCSVLCLQLPASVTQVLFMHSTAERLLGRMGNGVSALEGLGTGCEGSKGHLHSHTVCSSWASCPSWWQFCAHRVACTLSCIHPCHTS